MFELMPVWLLLSWTWGRAVEMALTGMLTALGISFILIILVKLLQIFAARIETGATRPVAGETVHISAQENDILIAVITTAVFSMLEDSSSRYRINKIIPTEKLTSKMVYKSWWQVGHKQLLESRLELDQIRRNKQREKI